MPDPGAQEKQEEEEEGERLPIATAHRKRSQDLCCYSNHLTSALAGGRYFPDYQYYNNRV